MLCDITIYTVHVVHSNNRIAVQYEVNNSRDYLCEYIFFIIEIIMEAQFASSWDLAGLPP